MSLLHNHVVAIQATPRGLGNHWQQAPVILEDALGFVIPIPLELVNNWGVSIVYRVSRLLRPGG